jgi:NDP-sugar pyrophosphorylase family protein
MNALGKLGGIVLAAGAGSRTGYLADILPKFLVPVAGRPLLWHALSALAALGVADVTIVARQRPELIHRYLDRGNVRGLGLGALRVKSLTRPTRTPVESLLNAVPNAPRDFAVTYGDCFTQTTDLWQMRALFERIRPRVAELVVRDRDLSSIRRACEVIPGADHKIAAIREKPRKPRSRLRGCGLYIFRGDTFPALVREAKNCTKLESLTDLVATAAHDGAAAFFQTRGRNINVNTIADLQAAWTIAESPGPMPL